MIYFDGLFGIYILSGHFPLNARSCNVFYLFQFTSYVSKIEVNIHLIHSTLPLPVTSLGHILHLCCTRAVGATAVEEMTGAVVVVVVASGSVEAVTGVTI